MIFVAYGVYVALLVLALWRARAMRWFQFAAVVVFIAPVVGASAITAFAIETDRGPAAAIAVLAAGAWLFGVSVLSYSPLRPFARLWSRLVGWGLIASVTLVPATTVLFAPISGLLAFIALDFKRKHVVQ